MDTFTRSVISRYFEDEQDSLDPTIDELDFVEYLKKKNNKPIHDTTKGNATYNPYDYKDPSSEVKDMGDSEVFTKDYPSYPAFGKKKVFDTEEPLGYWRRVRRDDSTEDPQEQAPNMSLVNRYSSAALRVVEAFNKRMAIPYVKLKKNLGMDTIDLGLEKLDFESIKKVYDDLVSGKTVKIPSIPGGVLPNPTVKEFKLNDIDDAIKEGGLSDKDRLIHYFEDTLKKPKGKFISEKPHPLKYDEKKHEYILNPEHAYSIKESSVNNVISEFLISHMPIITTLNELGNLDHCDCLKTAATLNEIISKHHHKNLTTGVLESKGVNVDWKRFNSREGMKKGFVTFKARSQDSNNEHTVIFQFLKDDKEDITKPDKAKSYADLPVALSCSCESFLYYGAQWYALQGMYMYMPALRRSVLPPVSESRISRVYPGKGLNFRVCKHILACYEIIKTWKVQTEFKRMIKYTPLSLIVNPRQWKQSFGMDFSYKNIRDYLKKPTPIPTAIKSFFRYKKETVDQRDALKALDEYFKDRWAKKSVSEKIQVLKAYINHPEEIFYFLMREAINRNGNINDQLAKEGIILISKTIDPNYARVLVKGDFEAVPGKVPIEKREEKGAPREKVKGMPLVKPEEEEGPSSSRFETKKPEEKEEGRFEGPKKLYE